jgi:hypothetical protein
MIKYNRQLHSLYHYSMFNICLFVPSLSLSSKTRKYLVLGDLPSLPFRIAEVSPTDNIQSFVDEVKRASLQIAGKNVIGGHGGA